MMFMMSGGPGKVFMDRRGCMGIEVMLAAAVTCGHGGGWAVTRQRG